MFPSPLRILSLCLPMLVMFVIYLLIIMVMVMYGLVKFTVRFFVLLTGVDSIT